MACRDLCLRLKSAPTGRVSEYDVGKRFCRRCHCFFLTERLYCQCCGSRLRYKPRDHNAREKHRTKSTRQQYCRMYNQQHKDDPRYRELRRLNREKYNHSEKGKIKNALYRQSHPRNKKLVSTVKGKLLPIWNP